MSNDVISVKVRLMKKMKPFPDALHKATVQGPLHTSTSHPMADATPGCGKLVAVYALA
jgi:hypothetical protein